MNRLDWFELVEQAEEVYAAWRDDGVISLREQAEGLASMVLYHANKAAEAEGWYSELENYIDTMTFAD